MVAVLTVSPAMATDITGNTLHELCRSQLSHAQLYVAGFWDGIVNFGGPMLRERICLPDGVTIEQAADMVCRDLERVPSIRHENGAFVVGISLGNAFPCK